MSRISSGISKVNRRQVIEKIREQSKSWSFTKEKLLESRERRQEIIRKYGCVPISVLCAEDIRDPGLDELVEDTLARQTYHTYFDFGDIKVSYPNISKYALSQFPVGIAKLMIQMWSEPGDIYFDPFCERLPRLIIAHYLGRHVIGYDISKEAMKHNIEKIRRRVLASQTLDPDNNFIMAESEDHLEAYYQGRMFMIYRRDSRKIHLDDNSVDAIGTSPPYWDTEYYGDEPEQIGNVKDYRMFLANLEKILRECYRILRPGKFIVVNVNDFRKNGVFYPYHVDVYNIMRKIGFKPWDIVIFTFKKHPRAAIWLDRLDRNKYVAKAHEYLLVFRK